MCEFCNATKKAFKFPQPSLCSVNPNPLQNPSLLQMEGSSTVWSRRFPLPLHPQQPSRSPRSPGPQGTPPSLLRTGPRATPHFSVAAVRPVCSVSLPGRPRERAMVFLNLLPPVRAHCAEGRDQAAGKDKTASGVHWGAPGTALESGVCVQVSLRVCICESGIRVCGTFA